MNAEFRAYIDAVTDGCCEETRTASVTDRVRKAIAVIGDAFTEILKYSGPFHCDLHPWTRVRQTIRECCKHHEAIGYHGLA